MYQSIRRAITFVLILTIVTALNSAISLHRAQAAGDSTQYLLVGVIGGTGRFYSIDTETGVGTQLFVAPGRRIEGLAYDPVRKSLYGVNNGINSVLVKIDLTNQTITDVGIIDGYDEITAFTYDDTTGNLYALDQTTYTLLSIDPDTAARTVIGRFFYGAANALAAQPGTGNLYAIVGVDPSRLATINKSTAALSLIGSTGFVAAPSLAFHPATGVLYTTVDGSSLATVNTTTGQVTVIQPSSISGQYTSLEFVPDPASAPQNQPPTVNAGGPYTAEEGSSIMLYAQGNDPEGDILTYSWDLDDNGIFETQGQSVTFSAAGFDGPSSRTITVQVIDSGGLSATGQATVNVLNVAPTAGTIMAPIDPVQLNTTINTTANFTDPGVFDTHVAVWDWGDGSTSAGTVNEMNGSGSATGSHAYAGTGVYEIKVSVTDDDGDSGQSIFQYVVVYDPGAGFVTGGGWINSPAGAYVSDPTLTGKANFGFVSKYQKGANVPTGQTQFQFRVANLDFHSTSYDWLVVAGVKAQYKGVGTVSGCGDYGFLLTATDGQLNGGGSVDKFRIKIWDNGAGSVIYDNQMDASDTEDPATTLLGGSIVIHK